MGIAKIIALDGPAASGKSTIGKKLADRLGYFFFDTGLMYRAVTWLALSRRVDLLDGPALARLAETVDMDIRPPSYSDGRSSDVFVEGKDVTWDIRLPEVDANVSLVSKYPEVRHALTGKQRQIARRGDIVMAGRDIGTVVLPDADLKIYLDASVEERARRRFEEMVARGEQAVLEDIEQSIRERDYTDSTREFAPLKPAEDAVIVSTDGLKLDETLEKVLAIVYRAGT